MCVGGWYTLFQPLIMFGTISWNWTVSRYIFAQNGAAILDTPFVWIFVCVPWPKCQAHFHNVNEEGTDLKVLKWREKNTRPYKYMESASRASTAFPSTSWLLFPSEALEKMVLGRIKLSIKLTVDSVNVTVQMWNLLLFWEEEMVCSNIEKVDS